MKPGYRPTVLWNLGFSAYWFANNWKWYIVLLVLLPRQVAEITPEASRNGALGMILAIGGTWAIFGAAIFGALSDGFRSRWGHRSPFIAVGAGLTVLALAWLAKAETIPGLIVGYLLLQITDDIATGPYGGMVAEVVPEEHRGQSSSILNLLRLLGQIISGVSGWMLGSVTLMYAGCAIVNVVCAVWTLYAIRGIQPLPRPSSAATQIWQKWLRPWRSRDFRLAFGMRMLSALAFFLITSYLRNFLQFLAEHRGMKLAAFGSQVGSLDGATILLSLVAFASAVVGAISVVGLVDRWGRKRLLYIAGGIIALVLVPFALVPNYEVLLVLASVFGFGYGIYTSADFALVSDVLPHREDAGAEMGVWQASFTSVQLVAGTMGGVIDALNRFSIGTGYSAAIWLAGLLFILSVGLVRAIHGSR